MTTTATDQPPPGPSKWSAGRVIVLVVSSIAALIGLALLVAGAGLLAAYGLARDDDGFYTTDNALLRAPGYAISSDRVDLESEGLTELPDGLLGTVRLEAEGAKGADLFLGIGPSADVDRYLHGVARSEIEDFSHRGRPQLASVPGREPRTPPGAQGFWVSQSSGTGERRVDWDAEEGVWTAVLMNADGTRPVAADVDVGVKVGWVLWVGLGCLAVGLAVIATAVLLIIHVSRRAARDPVTPAVAPT
jgi:hypothetical protein